MPDAKQKNPSTQLVDAGRRRLLPHVGVELMACRDLSRVRAWRREGRPTPRETSR